MNGWQKRSITFIPPIDYITARTDKTISLDMTPFLVDNGAPSLPQTVLIRQDTKETVTLQDVPVLNGNSVQQRLRGLDEGVLYKLYVSVLTSGMRIEGDLNIDVADD